jgi:hypothetical protein
MNRQTPNTQKKNDTRRNTIIVEYIRNGEWKYQIIRDGAIGKPIYTNDRSDLIYLLANQNFFDTAVIITMDKEREGQKLNRQVYERRQFLLKHNIIDPFAEV